MDEVWGPRRPRREVRARQVAGILFVVLTLLVSAIVAVVLLNQGGRSAAPIGAVDSPTPGTWTPGAATSPPTHWPATDPPATPSPSVALTPNPTAEPTPEPPTPPPTPAIPLDATIDDALARCPTAAEIELVDSRIRLTFVDDFTAPELVCRRRDGSANLTRLQERAYQAVLSMRRLRFDEPLPWTDRSLFGWFTRAVTGIQFEAATYSHCCAQDNDIVIRSQTDMAYLQDYTWDGMKGLVGLMAHEARHAEGYYHNCGESADNPGVVPDDQTLEEGGAWAVNYWYLVWLADHADDDYVRPADGAPDAYREKARVSAEGILKYRICDNYQ